jgi:hypothetical protein
MPRRRNISSILIICAAPSLAACTERSDSATNSVAGARSEKRAVLDQIASECGLPPSNFTLIDDAELRFQPSPDADYEAVDCALRRVRETALFNDVPMGFVGNEAFR